VGEQSLAETIQRRALRARWLLPIDRPPIAGGCVAIEGERIVEVGPAAETGQIEDLGDVALMPGLINAHTHLELSDAAQPIGKAGTPLPDWIWKVLELRNERKTAKSPIAKGLRECIAAGVTTVADIVQPTASLDEFAKARVDVVAFLELIGLASDRIDERVACAKQHIATPVIEGKQLTLGLSPHAPYSVHPEVVRRVCDEVAHTSDRIVPVAMHVAESHEELQLLHDGTGPFRTLLEELGAWRADAIGRGTRPLDYLKLLASAPRALVIHGNYLDRTELEFVAARRDRMTLVYCPRTHAYFRHSPYPLAEAIALGVNVALGTDSRASSPDLNVLAEMRFVAAEHGIAPERVFRMATANTADALGQENDIGTITPGKLANLTSIPLPSDTRDPYEAILTSDAQPVQTWWRGERLVPPSLHFSHGCQ